MVKGMVYTGPGEV